MKSKNNNKESLAQWRLLSYGGAALNMFVMYLAGRDVDRLTNSNHFYIAGLVIPLIAGALVFSLARSSNRKDIFFKYLFLLFFSIPSFMVEIKRKY